MSEGTRIEWCDHTFNPWWGCARVSKGCEHCYAETFAKRYGHDVWGKGGERRFFGDAHWAEPLKWNRKAEAAGVRARVFCASMADVFEDHPELPPHRERLWELIERTPNLDWLLLTKRPENMFSMGPSAQAWGRNIWAGTTVEDQAAADKRIPYLLNVPAAVRFLSCEPLLGPVDLSRWLGVEWMDALDGYGHEMFAALSGRVGPNGGIHWVIAGGESGHGARPMHPDWARTLRDQCVAAGVAFHFKQWGQWRPFRADDDPQRGFLYDGGNGGALTSLVRLGKKAAGRELDGRTWDEFPASLSGGDS